MPIDRRPGANGTVTAPTRHDDPSADRRRLLGAGLAGACGAAGLLPAGAARAQESWPSKPIRIVVGFAPGGLTDGYARAYGDFISRKLGQPVVIENKPGAGAMIAGEVVAKSPPDGYTYFMSVTTTIWQNRVLYNKMPFDPDKDLTLVTIFPSGGLVFAIPADHPAKTVKEWIEWAKTNNATMASYAPASVPHMAADMMNREFGARINAIQYKGEGPMWPDVASGQVSAGIGSYQAIAPYLAKNRVRPLAATGTTRLSKLPDLPTLTELGYTQPVFRLSGGLPMTAPAGTPEAILQKLSAAIQEGYDDPKVKAVHDVYGVIERPDTIEVARRRHREDGPQWIALARSLNVKLD